MKIIVAGLINLETTVKIRQFPIEYYPIDYPFFGVMSTVSGVGMNLEKALLKLGDEAIIFALTANDEVNSLINNELKKGKIKDDFIKPLLKETPASVVLYDNSGRRQIYCDLKDWQDQIYPIDQKTIMAIKQSDAMIICNANMNRPLLKVAKELGKLIISDVHVLANISDEYNRDFMENADILFLSDEAISSSPYGFIKELYNLYHNKIIVMGRGKFGSTIYLGDENIMYDVYSVNTREVISTVGAGDALLASFVHFYLQNKDELDALKKATLFASYKIGDKGAAKGFLSENELLELASKYTVNAKRVYWFWKSIFLLYYWF